MVGVQGRNTMSNAPSTLDAQEKVRPANRIADVLDHVESVSLTKPLQFAGFWSAVVLPFCYLPMVVGGLASSYRTVFGALLVFHAVALVVGYGYDSE